jgi:hypothetical protein
MPLNTRDVMRSDDHDSSSQLPIVFRYGTGSLAVMILGFPILLAMFVLFPIMSVHQLMRPVSFGMKLDAVAVCGLGLAFGWICFAITRTWHSFFTFYEVDRQGIKARLRSVGTLLSVGPVEVGTVPQGARTDRSRIRRHLMHGGS